MATKEQPGKPSWFKRHKILTGILGVFVLIAIASAAGGSKSKTPTTSASTASTPAASTDKAAAAAKIGDAVRDGKFEFVVKSIDCGKTTVGSEYLNKTAQGQFCSVDVSVKNIGNESQTMFSTNQKAYNAANQTYKADDTATIYAADLSKGNAWYQDINPGNTVEGAIIFDIPKDTTLASIKLHDSAYSGGVSVNLQ